MALLRVCLVLLAGVALGVTWAAPSPLPIAAGAVFGVVAIFAHRSGMRKAPRNLLLAAVLSLGAARGTAEVESLAKANPYAETGPRALLCRVVSDPESAGLRQTYTCLVEAVDDRASVPWRAAVSAAPVEGLLYGDRVVVVGEPETPGPKGYAEHLLRRGVTATVYATGVDRRERGPASPMRWLYAVRRQALAGLQEAVPQPEAGFLSGVALGSTEGLPDLVEDDLRRSGLLHILVVSGANVAFLVGALVVGLRRLVGWSASLVAALLLSVGYCLITGGDPPVIRGAVMVLLALGAQAAGRPGHGWTALAVAAASMAVANPLLVQEPSYQLSVATSGGMLAAQGVRWPSRWRASAWRPLAEALLATLAAQLAALPLSAAHFGVLPGLGVLSNALILPMQPIQMLLAMLAAVTAALAPAVATVVALPAWLCARVTLIVAHRAASLPLATLECSPWPAGAVAAYYLVLAAAIGAGPRRLGTWVRSLRSWRPARAVPLGAVLAVVAVAVWGAALQLPDGRLHVSFLDVGQGDAILITTPSGARVLVDGGADPDRLRGYLGRALPVWSRRLDVVALTHPDLDHMGGLLGLPPRYSVGLLLRSAADPPQAWAGRWQQLEEAADSVVTAAAGQVLDLGDGVALEVLYPSGEGCPTWGSTDNDCSAVLRLRYGEASFLLTGDAEGAVESLLLASEQLEPSWVLKVSHHGSSRGTSDALLEAVRPRIAVVSVGENRYGHPAAEVLARISEHGAECLRTDQSGTIEIETDGSRYSISHH